MKTPFLFLLCGLLVSCDPSGYLSGPVGKALRNEVRERKQREIDLVSMVPFKWDELFLFEPYSPRSEVCKELRLKESECSSIVKSESTDDGQMLLVFKLEAQIVHTEMHIRFNGDFTPLDFKQPITPTTAKFRVQEEGHSASGKPWLRLRPTKTERSNNALQGTRQKRRRAPELVVSENRLTRGMILSTRRFICHSLYPR
jgi:hypothetical protein